MQRNGFFAHSEAVLLAMLADSEEEIRVQAVNTILAIRSGVLRVNRPLAAMMMMMMMALMKRMKKMRLRKLKKMMPSRFKPQRERLF